MGQVGAMRRNTGRGEKMKKGVLTGGVVLLLAMFIPPQAAARIDFGLGIKGGLCASNVSWSLDNGSGGPFRRPTFGILAVFNLGSTFAIQPELDYVTTGFSWWIILPPEIAKYEDTLKYLQIPVLFKARLIPGGRIVPVVFAGPALGILLSAPVRTYDVNGSLVFERNARDIYRSVDLGAAFGVGAEILVGQIKLIVDVRYYQGLTDVYESPDFAVKNAGLMITGGIGF